MDHSNNDCLVVIILSHGELVPYYDRKSGDESDTLLSHDLMSHVHSSDSMYPLQMIWTYFTDENCPTLANKPRIFIVQACQGNKTDPGVRLITKRSTQTECDSASEDLDTIPIDAIKTIQPFARRGLSVDETDGKPYEPIKVKQILPQKDFLIAYASLPGYYSFRNTLNGAWFIQSLCKELDEREPHHDLAKILTLTSQAVAYDFESHSYDLELDLKKQIPCVSTMLTKLLLFPKKHTTNGY